MQKNEKATEVIMRILEECTWMNVFTYSRDEIMTELRIESGYGGRWTING